MLVVACVSFAYSPRAYLEAEAAIEKKAPSILGFPEVKSCVLLPRALSEKWVGKTKTDLLQFAREVEHRSQGFLFECEDGKDRYIFKIGAAISEDDALFLSIIFWHDPDDRISRTFLMWEAIPYKHKKTEPNQALEPTSTAVTPPAVAGDRASGTRGSP